MPQLLSSRLLDVFVKRMVRKPGSIPWVLKTWDPAVEESTVFLQRLTEKMRLEWWKRQSPTVREQILDGLIRIDNGRGIIVDWLAAIVREERDLSVLEAAARWESLKYSFTDRLLDAWHDRSLGHSSNTAAIRGKALEVIVNAILPSGTSSENEDGNPWNEERRAAIILKDISECLNGEYSGQWDIKHIVDRLEILSGWEPSPELYGRDVLSGIFCQWERHMQNIAGIMEESKKKPHKDWGEIANILPKYLGATWKGLASLSSYCADQSDTGGRLLFWMEYWLQCDREHLVSSEIISGMAEWNPPDDTLREKAAVLWSRYLLSFHGYENPSVWTALGRYFSGCRQPGPKAGEIVRNCLNALELVGKMPVRAKSWVMEAIVCPPWLTAEQQVEWENLWITMITAESTVAPDRYRENIVQISLRHLLGLVTAGPSGWNRVKEVIEAILERLKKNEREIFKQIFKQALIHINLPGLTDEFGQWEGDLNSPGERFYGIWVQLCQYPWWKYNEVRTEAIMALAACLRENLARKADISRLESLWLETLRGENHPLTIQALQEGQSEIMKIHPGFCPDSLSIWKVLGQHEDAEIRSIACRFFISLEDSLKGETETFLMERLREEKNLDVLETMAQWKPSSGKPWPPGFLEGWTACLQEAVTNMFQGPNAGEIRYFARKKIIDIAGHIVRNFAVAWLENQLIRDGSPAGMADLRIFWKTVIGKGNFLEEPRILMKIITIQKDLDILSMLDEPPERFFSNFHDLRNFNESPSYDWGVPLIWKNFIENLADRDVETLPVNIRHNVGKVVVSLKDYKKDIREEWFPKVFVKLCGDGTWTPDEVPAGWDQFCREFIRFCQEINQKDKVVSRKEERESTERICRMIHTGHLVGDERCHHIFRHTLCQVMKSARPLLASVLENALWREVVMAAGMAERLGGEEKGLDEAGQRRWLREFIRSHEQTLVGDEGSEATKVFWNSLWTGLNPCSSLQGTTRGRWKGQVKGLAMDHQALVFFHPHRDGHQYWEGNQSVKESVRLVETTPRGGQRLSFFQNV